ELRVEALVDHPGVDAGHVAGHASPRDVAVLAGPDQTRALLASRTTAARALVDHAVHQERLLRVAEGVGDRLLHRDVHLLAGCAKLPRAQRDERAHHRLDADLRGALLH